MEFLDGIDRIIQDWSRLDASLESVRCVLCDNEPKSNEDPYCFACTFEKEAPSKSICLWVYRLIDQSGRPPEV
jgi:hypothetical protein